MKIQIGDLMIAKEGDELIEITNVWDAGFDYKYVSVNNSMAVFAFKNERWSIVCCEGFPIKTLAEVKKNYIKVGSML